MTKEQFETLSKYESSFQEAKSNYYRAILMTDLQTMNDIWTETGHERAQLTCGKCVLTFLQKLGSEYYAYKDSLKPEKQTIEEPVTKTKTKKNAKRK